jgi:hypothetical protein
VDAQEVKMARTPIPLLLSLSLTVLPTQVIGAGAPGRKATRAQVRGVAHSLFSFERVKIRGDRIQRYQATRGYYGQHELRFKSGKHVEADRMLSFLFGPGAMRVQGKGPERTVLWQATTGKVRTLGRLQRIGREIVFRPTNGVRQHRNRLLGSILAEGLESKVTGVTYGRYWTSWVEKKDKVNSPERLKVRYQPGQTTPTGSTSTSGSGLLERSAKETAAFGDALQPVWGMHGGKTRGGMSVSWTSKGEQGKLARHRLIFRPEGWHPGRTFDAVLGMIMGDSNGKQGGADYEKEVFAPGARRKREITRRSKRAVVGWLKDQQKRWKHLTSDKKRGARAVSREIRVISGLLQLGTRDYSGKERLPKPSVETPPNLMLSTLFGRGKLEFGKPGSDGERSVYWMERGAPSFKLGTMRGRAFRPEPQVVQKVHRYIGEKVLEKVISDETVRKGYGYDADRRSNRFRREVQSESKERVGLLPMKRKILITENTYYSGHILDTIGSLWPKALDGLVHGGSDGVRVSWTSDRLVQPKRGSYFSPGRGGELVPVPDGYQVKHKLTFDRHGGLGSDHRVFYSYEIAKKP